MAVVLKHVGADYKVKYTIYRFVHWLVLGVVIYVCPWSCTFSLLYDLMACMRIASLLVYHTGLLQSHIQHELKSVLLNCSAVTHCTLVTKIKHLKLPLSESGSDTSMHFT